MQSARKAYQAVVEMVLGQDIQSWSEVQFALHEQARQCDYLRERLAQNAREMADRFVRFASRVESEAITHDNPMKYSTAEDILVDGEKLQALQQAFGILFKAVTGQKFSDAAKAQ